MNITIHNENLHVTISTMGAQLKSVKLFGKERLWQPDPAFWNGSAPILFPVPGALNNGEYTFNGNKYQMPFHGFARDNNFNIIDFSEEQVTMELVQNENTKKFYPFDFSFKITYSLENNTLNIKFNVENKGNDAMWFTFGSHESFLLEGKAEDCLLQFEKDEKFNSLAVAQGKGVLSHNSDDFGEGKILDLKKDKFMHGTIILKDVNSKKVNLLENGKKLCTFTFDAKNLLCWTVENAHFVCIEPWQSCPDYEDFYDDITKKDGVIVLSKGESYTSNHSIEYFD